MNDGPRPSPALLAEAFAALAAGAAARRLIPFPILARRLSANGAEGCQPREADVAPVRRAIDAWTRRMPVRPKCFARGLAAFWMLRRRGFSARLYYGAATIDGTLKAHVWVRSGPLDVVGCEIAGDYALLATFPDSAG